MRIIIPFMHLWQRNEPGGSEEENNEPRENELAENSSHYLNFIDNM